MDPASPAHRPRTLLIAATILTALASSSTSWATTAINGVLMVDCDAISMHRPLPLEGQWNFVWQPEDMSPLWRSADTFSNHVEVPGTWGWEPSTQSTSHLGHATYRLELRFLGQCPAELAVRFPVVGSAFESFILWPDGQSKALGGRGQFSQRAKEAVHQHFPFVARWKHRNDLPAQLFIKIAKFKGTPGGLWRPPQLSDPDTAHTRVQRSAQQQFFVLGILIFITFYHLVLFLGRRNELSSLYFALVCLLMASRIFFVHGFLDPWIPNPGEWLYEFRIRLDWVTYALLVIIVYRYLDYLFPEQFSRRWYQQLAPLATLCIIISIVFELTTAIPMLRLLHILTLISVFFVAQGLYRSAHEKIVGAKTIAVGITLFIITGVIDILTGLGFIASPVVAPAGLILFVFFNSHVISKRHALALETAERLTRDLQYEVGIQTMELRNRTWEAEHARESAVLAKIELEELNRNITEKVLKRYLPPRLIDEILAGRQQVDEEPRFMDITVLFTDLAGFTSLSEELGTKTISRLLNEYLTAMADVVFENGGTIDKFIGDSIMVLFGAPLESEPRQQVNNAVGCARAMRDKLKELNQHWASQGLPILAMRMGIHRGPALVGNLGSDRRSDYTAIGSTVNIASRIEGVCTPGCAFMSESVAQLVASSDKTSVGEHKLKGISNPMELFRLSRSNVVELSEAKNKIGS